MTLTAEEITAAKSSNYFSSIGWGSSQEDL